MAASDETPKQAPTDPTDPNNGWESIIYQENNSTSGTRDAKDGVSATTQCYVHPKQTVQTATPTVCNNEQHSSLLRRAESDRARSSSVRNAVSNGTAMVSPINGFPQAESSDQLLLRLESQVCLCVYTLGHESITNIPQQPNRYAECCISNQPWHATLTACVAPTLQCTPTLKSLLVLLPC